MYFCFYKTVHMLIRFLRVFSIFLQFSVCIFVSITRISLFLQHEGDWFRFNKNIIHFKALNFWKTVKIFFYECSLKFFLTIIFLKKFQCFVCLLSAFSFLIRSGGWIFVSDGSLSSMSRMLKNEMFRFSCFFYFDFFLTCKDQELVFVTVFLTLCP